MGFAAITLCGLAFILVLRLADFIVVPEMDTPTGLTFRAPVQLAGATMEVNVLNIEVETLPPVSHLALPSLLGLLHGSWVSHPVQSGSHA